MLALVFLEKSRSPLPNEFILHTKCLQNAYVCLVVLKVILQRKFWGVKGWNLNCHLSGAAWVCPSVSSKGSRPLFLFVFTGCVIRNRGNWQARCPEQQQWVGVLVMLKNCPVDHTGLRNGVNPQLTSEFPSCNGQWRVLNTTPFPPWQPCTSSLHTLKSVPSLPLRGLLELHRLVHSGISLRLLCISLWAAAWKKLMYKGLHPIAGMEGKQIEKESGPYL